MSKNVGTLVIATVRPYDSLDAYASSVANEIQGGHHQVADITARDAITTQRRVEGMLVYVISVATMYRLVGGITNDKWVEFSGGVSSSFFTIGATRSFDATKSYLSAHGLATNVVPIILPTNTTLTAMSLSAAAMANWNAEVRLGGILVSGAVLASGGGTSAYSAAYNINFNAGDGVQIYCNGTGIKKPRVTLWFNRR
jgi:hypothetical protein